MTRITIALLIILPSLAFGQKDDSKGYDLALSAWDYFMNGNYEKSLELCNRALEVNDSLCLAYHYKTLVLLVLDESQEAIESGVECMKCNKSDIDWDPRFIRPNWFRSSVIYDFEMFRSKFPDVQKLDFIAKLYNIVLNLHMPQSYEEYKYYKDSIPGELRPYRTLFGDYEFEFVLLSTDIDRRIINYPSFRKGGKHKAVIHLNICIDSDGRVTKSEVDKINSSVELKPGLFISDEEYINNTFNSSKFSMKKLIWEKSKINEECGKVVFRLDSKGPKRLRDQ